MIAPGTQTAMLPARFSITYGGGDGFVINARETPERLAEMAAAAVRGRITSDVVRLTLVLGIDAIYSERLRPAPREPLDALVLRWARKRLAAGGGSQLAVLTPNVIDFLEHLVDRMVDEWIGKKS